MTRIDTLSKLCPSIKLAKNVNKHEKSRNRADISSRYLMGIYSARKATVDASCGGIVFSEFRRHNIKEIGDNCLFT